MNRRWVSGVLVIAFLLAGYQACAAESDEELIKARGDASVKGSGPTALASAVAYAQRRILAETLEAAFSLSDVTAANSVLDKAVLYIKSTQVVATSSEGEVTKAEVECFVRRKKLLADAALLLLPQLPFPPSVLILSGEQVGEETVAGADAQSAKILRDFFKGTEFELVEQQQIRKCHSDEQTLAVIRGDNEVAAQFAKERFADVLVVGFVNTAQEKSGIAGSVVECKTSVTLRVFRGSDGKLLDAFSQQAVVHSAAGSEGVGQAVQDVCEKVKKDLLVACVIAATSLRTTDDLVVTVENPGSKARFDALVKAMNGVQGVADVEELLYTDALARVRVSYGGHPGVFVRAIETQRYEGQAVEVTRAVLRAVTMKCGAEASAAGQK